MGVAEDARAVEASGLRGLFEPRNCLRMRGKFIPGSAWGMSPRQGTHCILADQNYTVYILS